ncbi:zinc finger protein-domain-containing protein [Clohesyomyces aquaticus]|uniref:Zinc finger protein-domain-containing protein n=1 Tax=Clohesyomyces aquaticus TaxID=1231657 RepID=A0A1Y1Z488_9PLEO|nr:zinc finger protein-domain-containing protein [Clohesyomyces aquaticus]
MCFGNLGYHTGVHFLKRILSIRIFRATKPTSDSGSPTTCIIVRGECGTIWTFGGTPAIIKVPQEGKEDELYKGCHMHRLVEEAFRLAPTELRRDINVPSFLTWIKPINQTFWDANIKFFPEGFQSSYSLASTRIQSPPLPLIQAMFERCGWRKNKRQRKAFFSQLQEDNFLLRIFLGHRENRCPKQPFRLHDFDFRANEIESVGLDTKTYATTIGKTLAILHWRAGVDASGVEFVLGRGPMYKPSPTSSDFTDADKDGPQFINQAFDPYQQAAAIWLLDFDQCKRFRKDAAGIKQLERAFLSNDPCYPRPESKDPRDQALWEEFRKAYLDASSRLTLSRSPMVFIKIIERGARKSVSAEGSSLRPTA